MKMLDNTKQKFFFDILPPEQKQIWPALKPAASLDYTLYGGTAISLRLGQRNSVDFFDFFSSSAQNAEKLFEALPFLKESAIIQNTHNTMSFLVSIANSRVKLSFFNDLRIGRVGQPAFSPDGSVRLASLDDLMANKLKVILQSINHKDYLDIAAMLQAGCSLINGFGAAQAMFSNFSPIISAKTLCYFEGGDLHLIKGEVKEVLINAVKNIDFFNIPKKTIISQDLTEKFLKQS